MTTQEAHSQFDDIKKFNAPGIKADNAARFVDEEAGVVLYGFSFIDFVHPNRVTSGGGGLAVTSVPIKDTRLSEATETETPTSDSQQTNTNE